MRPRLISRGNAEMTAQYVSEQIASMRPIKSSGTTKGFNEAATDQSRKWLILRWAELLYIASMRPRLISRGNEDDAFTIRTKALLASMRPRLISRGNEEAA